MLGTWCFLCNSGTCYHCRKADEKPRERVIFVVYVDIPEPTDGELREQAKASRRIRPQFEPKRRQSPIVRNVVQDWIARALTHGQK